MNFLLTFYKTTCFFCVLLADIHAFCKKNAQKHAKCAIFWLFLVDF